MSTPLTINGVIFNYPQNFDTNWGVDATGWAQAVTSGMLQKAGGSFPLTADIDFGASFGLKAAYFETRATNPATAGTLRLVSADAGIAFRNNANGGNLILTTDASDDLVWQSHILLQNTNSLKLQDTGNAHTISVHSPSVATTYSITLPPNAGTNGQILQTDGTGITTWVNASGTGTVNSGTAGNFAYYATSTNVVSDSGISRTAPAFSGTVSALTLQTTQATNQLSFTGGGGGNQVRTLNIVATTTVGEVITVPDSGGSDTVALIGATQTFSGTNTFSGTSLLSGPATISVATVTLAADLAGGGHKLTNIANGSAAQDAVAFNQVGTQTDWVSYSPTILGSGTLTSVSFFWRRIGNTVYIRGAYTTGTNTATPVTISVPVAINLSHLPAQSLIGDSCVLRTTSANFTEMDTPHIFHNGVDVNNVYLAVAFNGNTFVAVNGNTLFSNGDTWTGQFSYPA